MLFKDLLDVIDDDEIMVGFYNKQGVKVDDFGIYFTADIDPEGKVLGISTTYNCNDDAGMLCIAVEI